MKRKITKEVCILYIDEYTGDELIAHIKYLQESYGEIKFGLEYDSYSDDKYIAVYQVREETDTEYEDRLASLKVQAERLTRAEQAEFRRLSAIYNKDYQMKPNLVKIKGSLASRYVDGKFDQMVTVDYNARVEEAIEYFRVNGITEEYENSGEPE